MRVNAIPSYEEAFSGPVVRYDTPHENFRGGIQIPRGSLPGIVYMQNPSPKDNLGHYLHADMVIAATSRRLADLSVQHIAYLKEQFPVS